MLERIAATQLILLGLMLEMSMLYVSLMFEPGLEYYGHFCANFKLPIFC